jgi:hypothetical protein
MRGIIAALIALPIALGASVAANADDDECKIRDSALCLANPHCHWATDKRGCYPGAPQYDDACAVHTDQAVCDTDTALSCKWSADAKKCEAKTN